MNEENNKLWLEIKNFYKKEFNIPPKLVDIMEIYDIMELCCRGKSNKNIALRLEIIDIEFIRRSLDLAFDFYGWEEDLDLDTRELYKRNIYNQYAYTSSLTTLSPLVKRCDAVVSWELNKKLDAYIELLDKYEKGH
jgi:hypothetical protein